MSGTGLQMMEPHAHPALMTGEMPELIEHPDAATDVRRHGGAGHPHLGKRPPAENETRPEYDVQCIGEPQRAHREHRVACAAKDRIDEEDEKHGGVAAEHDPREIGAHRDDRIVSAHQSQDVGREETEHDAHCRGNGDAKYDDLPGRLRRPLGILLADSSRDDRGRGERNPNCDGVDERHDRFGQADHGHRLLAETRHPEHIDDGEERLHDHLEHHRNREQQDRAVQRSGRVVVMLAPQGLPDDAPERGVRALSTSRICRGVVGHT